MCSLWHSGVSDPLILMSTHCEPSAACLTALCLLGRVFVKVLVSQGI